MALLASSEEKDRKFAVDKILKIRGDDENGDKSVRPRKMPPVNFDSTKLMTLDHNLEKKTSMSQV